MSDSSDDGENQQIPQGNGSQDRNWEWIACVYDMKQTTPESEITWNLSPSIMLTLPSEQNVQPKVDLIIESSKQFIFSEGLGWNWHKSWNIPDIHCTLDIRDPNTSEKLLPPSKIYAQIYVVRAVINQIHTFHLVDVSIKGCSRSDFESSRCVFSGLKFDTTSYNHEGSKFHLVIVVYLNQNKFEHPKILESRISPPIFVDSRKSARDTQQQKAQKLSSFIDPFLPENMEKKFVKRESKRKYNQDEQIDNNIEGLSNFFSAPNIRHKVKHPLFLAIKFSSCVKIYFNVNIIPFTNNSEKFVEVMQKQLMEAYNRSGSSSSLNIEDKPLILTIEHNLAPQIFKQKKINEFLEPLHGDVLHVMIDPAEIPKNFQKLEDIDGVKEAYKKVYPKISQQKFSNNDGDEDESEEPKSHQKGKKAKQEKEKKNYQSEESDEEYAGAQASKKIKQNEADSSQVNSMIESKKLQIKNPAQQSEIVLNSATQNPQYVANMILQGAKQTKDKIPKNPLPAGSAPSSTIISDTTTKPEEPSAGKATKGKGKRASKNTVNPQAQNEQISQPPQPNLPLQAPIPPQVPTQSQFPPPLGTKQPSLSSIPQAPNNINPMQWQQQQQQLQQPQQLPNSQQTLPKPPQNIPQQIGANGEAIKQQGIPPNFQNFSVPYGPMAGQIPDGMGFDGMQKAYSSQQGYQIGGAQGQALSQMQGFNGGMPGSQQRIQHPSQQGYNQPITGQYPPSQVGSGAQYNSQINKGAKEGYEELSLQQNRSASQVPNFKHPQNGNGTALLNQSQHYNGIPQADNANLETAEAPKQLNGGQYPPSQGQIPPSQQYNNQQAYQLYQRNNSQQFGNIAQHNTPNAQQQGRFVNGQQIPPKAFNSAVTGAGGNPAAIGIGGSSSMPNFYENQQATQFGQHQQGALTDPVNQYNSYGAQGGHQYQLNQGIPGAYSEDEEGNTYSGPGRYPTASQGGQFQFGQGVPNQGGYGGYPGYPHQATQQAIGGSQYGYAPSQYGGYYPDTANPQYMKQGMNPQFQAFYQSQQGATAEIIGGGQNMPYSGQIRPNSSSIPQNYFPTNSGKEDEF